MASGLLDAVKEDPLSLIPGVFTGRTKTLERIDQASQRSPIGGLAELPGAAPSLARDAGNTGLSFSDFGALPDILSATVAGKDRFGNRLDTVERGLGMLGILSVIGAGGGAAGLISSALAGAGVASTLGFLRRDFRALAKGQDLSTVHDYMSGRSAEVPWQAQRDPKRMGVSAQGIVGESLPDVSDAMGSIRHRVLSYDLFTNHLLGEQTPEGVAKVLAEHSPGHQAVIQEGLLRLSEATAPLAMQMGLDPLYLTTSRITQIDRLIRDGMMGSDPITARLVELHQRFTGSAIEKPPRRRGDPKMLDIARDAQRGAFSADKYLERSRMRGRTPIEMPLSPAELEEYLGMMTEYSKFTFPFVDPELHIDPTVKVRGLSHDENGMPILHTEVVMNAPVRALTDLEMRAGDAQLQQNVSQGMTEHNQRLNDLDPVALVPFMVKRIKAVYEASREMGFTAAERKAFKSWYPLTSKEIVKLGKGVVAQARKMGYETLAPETFAAIVAAGDQPEILSAITAAISSSMEWNQNLAAAKWLLLVAEDSPELANAGVSIRYRGPSVDVIAEELQNGRSSPTYRKWLAEIKAENKQFGGKGYLVSAADYVKAMRIRSGYDWVDAMFGSGNADISLKTRNFNLNLWMPMLIWALTGDRHHSALANGYSLPGVKAPAIGKSAEWYKAYADAGRMAAYELGLHPSDLQAITWMTWKKMKATRGWDVRGDNAAKRALGRFVGRARKARDVSMDVLGDESTQDGRYYLLDDRTLFDIVEGRESRFMDYLHQAAADGGQLVDVSDLAGKGKPIATAPRSAAIDHTPAGTKVLIVDSPKNRERVRGMHPTTVRQGKHSLWISNGPDAVSDARAWASQAATAGERLPLENLSPTARQFLAVEPTDFLRSLRSARRRNPAVAANLQNYTAAELRGYRTFLGPGGKTGFAINPEGGVEAIFNASDPRPGKRTRGVAAAASERAAWEGATSMSALDLQSQSLPAGVPGVARQAGFVETGPRSPFDPEAMTPEGKAVFGSQRPERVTMATAAPPTGVRFEAPSPDQFVPSNQPGLHLRVTIADPDRARMVEVALRQAGLVTDSRPGRQLVFDQGPTGPVERAVETRTFTFTDANDLRATVDLLVKDPDVAFGGLDDMAAWVDDVTEAPDGWSRVIEHHYTDGTGARTTRLAPDGRLSGRNTNYTYVPSGVAARLRPSKAAANTIRPASGGVIFGDRLLIRSDTFPLENLSTEGPLRGLGSRTVYLAAPDVGQPVMTIADGKFVPDSDPMTTFRVHRKKHGIFLEPLGVQAQGKAYLVRYDALDRAGHLLADLGESRPVDLGIPKSWENIVVPQMGMP